MMEMKEYDSKQHQSVDDDIDMKDVDEGKSVVTSPSSSLRTNTAPHSTQLPPIPTAIAAAAAAIGPKKIGRPRKHPLPAPPLTTPDAFMKLQTTLQSIPVMNAPISSEPTVLENVFNVASKEFHSARTLILAAAVAIPEIGTILEEMSELTKKVNVQLGYQASGSVCHREYLQPFLKRIQPLLDTYLKQQVEARLQAAESEMKLVEAQQISEQKRKQQMLQRTAQLREKQKLAEQERQAKEEQERKVKEEEDRLNKIKAEEDEERLAEEKKQKEEAKKKSEEEKKETDEKQKQEDKLKAEEQQNSITKLLAQQLGITTATATKESDASIPSIPSISTTNSVYDQLQLALAPLLPFALTQALVSSFLNPLQMPLGNMNNMPAPLFNPFAPFPFALPTMPLMPTLPMPPPPAPNKSKKETKKSKSSSDKQLQPPLPMLTSPPINHSSQLPFPFLPSPFFSPALPPSANSLSNDGNLFSQSSHLPQLSLQTPATSPSQTTRRLDGSSSSNLGDDYDQHQSDDHHHDPHFSSDSSSNSHEFVQIELSPIAKSDMTMMEGQEHQHHHHHNRLSSNDFSSHGQGHGHDGTSPIISMFPMDGLSTHHLHHDHSLSPPTHTGQGNNSNGLGDPMHFLHSPRPNMEFSPPSGSPFLENLPSLTDDAHGEIHADTTTSLLSSSDSSGPFPAPSDLKPIAPFSFATNFTKTTSSSSSASSSNNAFDSSPNMNGHGPMDTDLHPEPMLLDQMSDPFTGNHFLGSSTSSTSMLDSHDVNHHGTSVAIHGSTPQQELTVLSTSAESVTLKRTRPRKNAATALETNPSKLMKSSKSMIDLTRLDKPSGPARGGRMNKRKLSALNELDTQDAPPSTSMLTMPSITRASSLPFTSTIDDHATMPFHSQLFPSNSHDHDLTNAHHHSGSSPNLASLVSPIISNLQHISSPLLQAHHSPQLLHTFSPQQGVLHVDSSPPELQLSNQTSTSEAAEHFAAAVTSGYETGSHQRHGSDSDSGTTSTTASLASAGTHDHPSSSSHEHRHDPSVHPLDDATASFVFYEADSHGVHSHVIGHHSNHGDDPTALFRSPGGYPKEHHGGIFTGFESTHSHEFTHPHHERMNSNTDSHPFHLLQSDDSHSSIHSFPSQSLSGTHFPDYPNDFGGDGDDIHMDGIHPILPSLQQQTSNGAAT